MPLTTLDPMIALIVIDLQRGIVDHLGETGTTQEIISLLKKRSVTA